MVENNTDNHETAFTVSIDHITTTTGISAVERSPIILRNVGRCKTRRFPKTRTYVSIKSKEKWSIRKKRTPEATVDLCRLAGLKECGLCCEIMREKMEQ